MAMELPGRATQEPRRGLPRTSGRLPGRRRAILRSPFGESVLADVADDFSCEIANAAIHVDEAGFLLPAFAITYELSS
jgi:hypothetical protein